MIRTLLAALLCLGLVATSARAADDDTPAAAKTRKLLKTKISVDFKNTRMSDIKQELMDEVKGLKIMLDNKGGVSNNAQMTFAAKDKTVEEILNGMCDKGGDLGYVVISKKGNAYDGAVLIKKSAERGTEKPK